MEIDDKSLKALQNSESLFFKKQPNPDSLIVQDLTLAKERANIAIYERLLYDSRVWSCINRLVLYLQTFDWKVVSRNRRGSVRETKFFEEMFYRYDIISMHAYSAAMIKFFGFGVAEMMLDFREDAIVLKELRFLPQRWFGFNENRDLLFYKKGTITPQVVKHYDVAEMQDINELRVLLFSNNATYDNPFGEGDASRLYYEVMYRNAARQLRGYLAERYGTPTPVISYPDGMAESHVREVVDVMRTYMGDGVVAVPKSYDVKSFANKVDDELFQKQIEDADRLIQDIILLQSAGQDLRSVGSRSAIETFERMTYKGVFAIKRIVENIYNEVIRVLSILNGIEREYWVELYDAHEFDAKSELDNDERLMNVSGLKFKEEYFVEKYQINPAYLERSSASESAGATSEGAAGAAGAVQNESESSGL